MKRFKYILAAFLLVCTALIASAQVKTVKGVVVSAVDGEPLIGAAVTIDGSTSHYAITDFDGRFEIKNVPANAKEVIVSNLGYKEARVRVAAQVTVTLEEDANVLDAAVATGMYTVDRRLNTGSTVKIDAAESNISGMVDISRSLEGRAAGVSVQNVSGTFGTAPKIRVRGATSIYGSSKPLWVVDGVIMEDVVDVSADDLSSGDANTLISSAIAGLNSDDIESFDILKDGSATSIYGARAMAGVIVVTTKKGKAGQSHITYNGEYTYRLKPNYSTFNIMNSQDQMEVYQELEQKGYLMYAGTANAMNSGVYGKMYQLISQYDATNGRFGLENTEAARNAYLRAAEYRNTDWFDVLFNHTIQHNHSVSVSGGSERATYYASLSLLNDEGWTKQSSVNRYTTNLNVSYKLFDNLTANLISNASYRKQRAPGTLSGETDVVSGEVKRDFDINPYSYALNTSRALDANEFYTRNYARFNILHELENNYLDLDVTDFRVQGELKWKPIPQLELSGLAAFKSTATSQEHYILDDSNQALAYREMSTASIRDSNPFLYTDPENPYAYPTTVLPVGGIFERTANSMTGWDVRATANYNNTFGDHILSLFGGTEVNSLDRHSTWFRGWGMQYDFGEIASYDYNVFKKGAEDNTQYYTLNNTHVRSAAFFANGTYSYKGKYTLNATARYEGTNSLGRSRTARWLPTWNVSGSWNVHEESFMKAVYPTVSHLSVKASYSLTGDRPAVTNSVAVIAATNPWRPFASVTESALYIDDLANEELTYEKKHELNIGFESGFFDNRINLALDWYKRNNFDLIGPVTTQGIGGFINKLGNVASMSSNGIEVSLSTVNVKTRDFSWSTNLIYSHNENKVTQLENNTIMMRMISGSGFTMQGYPVRSLFSLNFQGLNSEGLPTFINEEGNVTVGNINFQERDEEKLQANLVYSGSVDPTDVGSLGNIFTWKGFKFNVYVTYSFGNVIRLDPVFRSSYDDLDSMPLEFRNRWTVPGDEKITDIPVIADYWTNRVYASAGNYLSYGYNAYNYSTARVAKGDFIRLKELSLSYDLPKKWVEKINLSALGLKLQATNLFLLYADKKLNGQDPEFFNTGGVAVPLAKQFTLTLKLGLDGVNKKAKPASESTYAPSVKPEVVVKEVPASTLKGAHAETLYFNIGESELSSTESFKLGRICQLLIDNPKARLTVTGYADEGSGTPRWNNRLAQERANAVVKLLESQGIDASRMTISQEVMKGGEQAKLVRAAVCVVEQ